ncbi:MAG: hypothetical protein AAF694_17340 [Bacteroidota bacterium]
MTKDDPQWQKDLQSLFPLFKTWKQLYRFVLVELFALIVLFYLFSRAFA